jgi:hypothetical protein
MTTLILRVLLIAVVVVWGSGLWVAARRRRLVTERDVRRSEAWHEATAGRAPHEDALLMSLDIALHEGVPTSTGDQENLSLPPEAEKQ